MSNFFTFISGIVIGIYIDQSYKIPKINLLIDKSIDYIKSLEK
jgi:hypothetical protein